MSLDGEVPFHFQWGILFHNFVRPLRERDANGRKEGKKGKRREREKNRNRHREDEMGFWVILTVKWP